MARVSRAGSVQHATGVIIRLAEVSYRHATDYPGIPMRQSARAALTISDGGAPWWSVRRCVPHVLRRAGSRLVVNQRWCVTP